MGTLFNQPPRDYQRVSKMSIDYILTLLNYAEEAHGMHYEDTLKVLEICELRRRNDLLVADREIWDEQIAGLGELLQALTAAINTRS